MPLAPLISNLYGEVLIRGQHLKDGGAYFKVREIHIKFQNFNFLLFNNENETPQNQKKKKKKIKISAKVSLFECL